MDWAQVLVIILSVFLALFLLLAIALVIMLIKITKQIKTVTNSAERTAKKAETLVSNFSAVSSPTVIAKVVSTFVKNFKK